MWGDHLQTQQRNDLIQFHILPVCLHHIIADILWTQVNNSHDLRRMYVHISSMNVQGRDLLRNSKCFFLISAVNIRLIWSNSLMIPITMHAVRAFPTQISNFPLPKTESPLFIQSYSTVRMEKLQYYILLSGRNTEHWHMPQNIASNVFYKTLAAFMRSYSNSPKLSCTRAERACPVRIGTPPPLPIAYAKRSWCILWAQLHEMWTSAAGHQQQPEHIMHMWWCLLWLCHKQLRFQAVTPTQGHSRASSTTAYYCYMLSTMPNKYTPRLYIHMHRRNNMTYTP